MTKPSPHKTRYPATPTTRTSTPGAKRPCHYQHAPANTPECGAHANLPAPPNHQPPPKPPAHSRHTAQYQNQTSESPPHPDRSPHQYEPTRDPKHSAAANSQ